LYKFFQPTLKGFVYLAWFNIWILNVVELRKVFIHVGFGLTCGGPAHSEIRLGPFCFSFFQWMSECSQGASERAERVIHKLLERANSVPSIESDSEAEKRRKFRQKLPTTAADLFTVGSG